jgi:hypothetical protein
VGEKGRFLSTWPFAITALGSSILSMHASPLMMLSPMYSTRRGSGAGWSSSACRKRLPLNFPYVCLGPVLVNWSFLVGYKMAQTRRFPHHRADPVEGGCAVVTLEHALDAHRVLAAGACARCGNFHL